MSGGEAPREDLFRKGELVVACRVFVSVSIALLIGRCFLLEPNHVPTGSMAPHRLGVHSEVICPDCRFAFAVGLNSEGILPQPICPNCGSGDADRNVASGNLKSGDRLWVAKTPLMYAEPKRWDELVFFAPGSPLSPHLKRVVGLPGESVRIVDGDVFIDGVRARKNAVQRRRTAVPVFDMDAYPVDVDRPGRWRFELEPGGDSRSSTNWTLKSDYAGSPILESAMPGERTASLDEMPWDWVQYRHFCPIRENYGPVRDFLAYDGAIDGLGNPASDLAFTARVSWNGFGQIQFRLTTAEADFRVILDSLSDDPALRRAVTVNGMPLKVRWSDKDPAKMGYWTWRPFHDVEMSWVDRRLEFRFDGRLAFDPLDIDELPPRRPEERFRDSPAGFAVRNGEAAVKAFRLYRDIHYTNRLATQPVIGFGVREPVRLPADGFFLLGDNSANSIDSRFWERGPAVPRSALIGVPIEKGRVAGPDGER